MRVSDRIPLRVGIWFRGWRTGTALLGIALLWGGWGAERLQAQQWRGRLNSRIQYIEARPLVLDSVPVGSVPDGGTQRMLGDIPVTCRSGETYCYYYRSGSEVSTSPYTADLDLNVFGFGIEGLRAYVSTRFRGAVGAGTEKFWPRSDDHFDLLAGYVELNRRTFRVRLGRDYQMSGLGVYWYDGGSALFRYRPVGLELEAYGGWGLERGLPERATSGALESLEEFQAVDDNLLFGFRGSAAPMPGVNLQGIYQREIETDESGIASERLGFEASYVTRDRRLRVEGHADYDLAAGWWGKAGAKLGVTPIQTLYLEGRYLRYRPIFSLQTIWVVFSPVAYNGWGFGAAWRPLSTLSIRGDVERRDYEDTGAEVLFFETTDRTWVTSASASFQPFAKVDFEGNYWMDWGFGAATHGGDLRANYYPRTDLKLGARLSAFQQLEEFRVGDGRVRSFGVDARWRTRAGTIYGAIENYWHDRQDDAAQVDWTQTRAALGVSYYLGSEPGRMP